MKYVIALIVGLTGTMVLGAPAIASSSQRISLTSPTANQSAHSVVVRGRVRGHVRSVTVEQRRGHRWLLLRTARVRNGSYAVTVKRAATTSYVRVGTAGQYSRAVAVPAVAATDACGTVIYKADGTPWTCTFDDEFNGTTLNRSYWMPQTAFAMGTQAAHTCYRDDPSNVNVAGGSLNLTITKLTTPMSCSFGGLTGPTSYASGGVMTYRMFSQQYGRFEARIKNTATTYPGLQETFWLWPDDRVKSSTSSLPWPLSGEMDVSETYSSQPTLSVPFLHYNLSTALGVTTAWNCSAPRGQWNTYDEVWSPTKVQILVNGKVCLTNTAAPAAFLKPYILAFSQGFGANGDVYDGRAPLGTMSIDNVKVWK